MVGACSYSGASLPSPAFVVGPEEPEAAPDDLDPLEKQNRAVFETNQEINHSVVYPVAKAYTEGVPQEVRDRISAFTTNLNEPVVFANNILQLRLEAAATTVGRFAINSTVGLGGLFDVAATQQLAQQSGDFGQTLYVWGVRDSPYVVLPLLGPTNVRDAIGTGVEFVAQLPVGGLYPSGIAGVASNVATANTVLSPLSDLEKVGDMETLEDSSLDFYSKLKSVAEQHRQAELDEALATSAFTAPVAPGSIGIEPVLELTASPAFAEKPPPLSVSGNKQAPQVIVIVGPPAIVEPQDPPAPAKAP